ncbi:translocation and assembly module lipoprotein TamL [Taibaiella koreensis]|uniref:translocation and assembly module lipoprotein TamL n=1 Tax=Taibaiella koreensis TaxID=1268548 RepID=UPI000E59F5AE|nr:BamA/TamA family outer membrane protein [Taibaiella koreensis]
MYRFRRYIYGLLLTGYVLQALSCSNSRYLADNESLYLGNKVSVTDTFTSKAEKSSLEAELSEAVRPKPNSSFLGVRLKLTLYNIAGVPKREKGFRNWLRNKIGEPPVMGSDVSIDGNNKVLTNILVNYGYFKAESSGSKETKKKKTYASFEIATGPRTHIRNVAYEKNDTSQLAKDVLNDKGKSLLKPGDPYSLQAIKDERLRIDNILKNKGYYYFSPEFILIDADTGIGANQADLTVKMKYSEMPRNAYRQYLINSVTVFPNYRLNSNTNRNARTANDTISRRRVAKTEDTLVFDNFRVIDRQHLYRPYVFYQAMQLQPGELYNKKDQNMALNRLVTLGAFKFVKNDFTLVKDSSRNLLDVSYLLTPYARKSFGGELGGYTQNDTRGGIRGSINWRNKNLFGGAEIFTIKLTGSMEAQFGGGSNVKRPNAYNAGLEANLNIPRFLIPFVDIKPSGMYIPRTIISAAYNYSLRAGFYEINSLSFGYGFNWKEDIRKDHKLYPFNITYVRTDTIDNTKSDQFNLSNLLFNGIIFGPTYEYTFNSQLDGVHRKSNFYFNGLIDLSGNLVGIAQKASPENPGKIFGSNYAQYLKAQVDFRYYYNLTPKTVLAARALFGYGYSYGNSSRLPNVKQFFSGGSSSLRGFPSRLVGPGTFNERYLRGTDSLIEILGDVKTEFSVEYRAKLYKFIEGGVFADAGNVWLQNSNPTFPGGTFSGSFYKELAVDAGLGLRFDFSILLLRLDFAFPIRKPWFPEGQRWRFNDIRFGDPDWRKENLFFNLAIGYPF